MKTPTAVAVLALVAFATASGYGNVSPLRRLPSIPVPRNYQAPVAHAAAVPLPAAGAPGYVVDEPPRDEIEPLVYKAPVRNVERAPIRVAAPASRYEEEAPLRRQPYGSRGSAGAAAGAPAAAAATKEELEDLDEEYASNAQYQFASAVDDGIHDQSQLRQETRDGKKVTGSYAYSDGFNKYRYEYIADENGFRIVSQSVEPISEDGPVVDLVNGKADVHTQIGGIETQYSVSADELALLTRRASALKKEEEKKY